MPVAIVLGFALMGAAAGPLLAGTASRISGRTPNRRRNLAVTAASAVVCGALAGRLAPDPDMRWALPAFLLLAAIGVMLAVIDLDTHRLPDVLTLSGLAAVGGLLTVVCAAAGDTAGLVRTGLGALVSVGLYGVLCAVVPYGLGFGDVKLAALLGVALAWLSWSALAVGIVLGFAYGAGAALVLLATRRAQLAARLPFGPAMLAGAFTAILVGDQLAGLYLAL